MARTASHALAEPLSNAASGQSQYFTVACPGSGCHQNCPLRTEVRDGRIVRIDAMPVPGAPEDTHACQRGLAAVDLPYNPNRLKYPMQRVGPEPRLRMNPADAAPRGILEQQLVRAYNDRGEVTLKVEFSQGIRPGTVWVEHGWWRKDFAGGHYQNLLRPINLPEKDMINPAFQVCWEMVRDHAAQAPLPGLAPYGLADQLFDCLAQVEPA